MKVLRIETYIILLSIRLGISSLLHNTLRLINFNRNNFW